MSMSMSTKNHTHTQRPAPLLCFGFIRLACGLCLRLWSPEGLLATDILHNMYSNAQHKHRPHTLPTSPPAHMRTPSPALHSPRPFPPNPPSTPHSGCSALEPWNLHLHPCPRELAQRRRSRRGRARRSTAERFCRAARAAPGACALAQLADAQRDDVARLRLLGVVIGAPQPIGEMVLVLGAHRHFRLEREYRRGGREQPRHLGLARRYRRGGGREQPGCTRLAGEQKTWGFVFCPGGSAVWPQCWLCAVCAVGHVGCCVGGGVPCGGKHIISTSAHLLLNYATLRAYSRTSDPARTTEQGEGVGI